MRQGGGRRRAIARRERQRSLANKRPRRLVDFYLELVLMTIQILLVVHIVSNNNLQQIHLFRIFQAKLCILFLKFLIMR
ncbi:MAG: hypothetical protein PHV07_04995 [Oscillospiraceae bacterium]|nr:hypothetical protein [Oscillospiraceae bacterium]